MRVKLMTYLQKEIKIHRGVCTEISYLSLTKNTHSESNKNILQTGPLKKNFVFILPKFQRSKQYNLSSCFLHSQVQVKNRKESLFNNFQKWLVLFLKKNYK